MAIIGAGPAGLIAAEMLARAGVRVTIYERKSSPARKFLLAGRGGLNITHSEDIDQFIGRYDRAQYKIAPMIFNFGPQDMREWCHGLGEETFVGSSGRVFPKSLKASPLLRAWIGRLQSLDVSFEYGMFWTGWTETGALQFKNKDNEDIEIAADAVVLALGGGTWPNLGSDGGWVDILRRKNIKVAELKPANCGFTCAWSDIFKSQFSGMPLKTISITHRDRKVKGEVMIDEHGVEGGAIYALSAYIRDDIVANGKAQISIDLRPSMTEQDLIRNISVPRGKKSFSNFMRGALSFSPLEINLLRESYPDVAAFSAPDMACAIKQLPLVLKAPFPMEKSISSAGGIHLDELTDGLMLKKMPGVFAAGEMLDWEAPTGGYLLQACFASGICAARGVLGHLGIPAPQ